MIHPKGTTDYQSLSPFTSSSSQTQGDIIDHKIPSLTWVLAVARSKFARKKQSRSTPTGARCMRNLGINTTYFVDKKSLFLDLSVPEVEGNCHGWQLEESLARTTSG
jgi:hypothetical protein